MKKFLSIILSISIMISILATSVIALESINSQMVTVPLNKVLGGDEIHTSRSTQEETILKIKVDPLEKITKETIEIPISVEYDISDTNAVQHHTVTSTANVFFINGKTIILSDVDDDNIFFSLNYLLEEKKYYIVATVNKYEGDRVIHKFIEFGENTPE